MKVLVKMNKKSLDIYLDKSIDKDLLKFANDEQIFYTGDDLVLLSKDYKEDNLPRYERELTKAMAEVISNKIITANNEVILANKKVVELNDKYLKLVNKLIGEEK